MIGGNKTINVYYSLVTLVIQANLTEPVKNHISNSRDINKKLCFTTRKLILFLGALLFSPQSALAKNDSHSHNCHLNVTEECV